jgi:hypothetical protein
LPHVTSSTHTLHILKLLHVATLPGAVTPSFQFGCGVTHFNLGVGWPIPHP